MKQGNQEEYEEKLKRLAEKEIEKKAMQDEKIRIRAAIY